MIPTNIQLLIAESYIKIVNEKLDFTFENLILQTSDTNILHLFQGQQAKVAKGCPKISFVLNIDYQLDKFLSPCRLLIVYYYLYAYV